MRDFWVEHIGVRLLTIALLAVLAGSALVSIANAATANLSWTAPTQYTDGTPLALADIVGYEFRCIDFTPTGGAPGACAHTALVVGPVLSGQLDVTVPAGGGVACFQGRTKTATAVGPWSVKVCKTYSAKAPKSPSGLAVN